MSYERKTIFSKNAIATIKLFVARSKLAFVCAIGISRKTNLGTNNGLLPIFSCIKRTKIRNQKKDKKEELQNGTEQND